MSGNKFTKTLKTIGHSIASGARRVKSRFKRFTVKTGAILTKQATIKTLQTWVENSKSTGTMSLKEIFERGGPCDIKVLKTCIGSIKATHSNSMQTSEEDFIRFNSNLTSDNGAVSVVRKCCDAVYQSLKSGQGTKDTLEDLGRSFGTLEAENWTIGAATIKNPYATLISPVRNFINTKAS